MEIKVPSTNLERIYPKLSINTISSSKEFCIDKEISRLECKVSRHKKACLDSGARPIDRENLVHAQSELALLRLSKVTAI